MCLKSFAGARVQKATLENQEASHHAAHYSPQEDMPFVGAVPCVFRMVRFPYHLGWRLMEAISICRRTSREDLVAPSSEKIRPVDQDGLLVVNIRHKPRG